MRSTCLTVAATLGAQLDQLCIVGGLVPSLLIDERLEPDQRSEETHPGTLDLDAAMQIALLDDQGYAEDVDAAAADAHSYVDDLMRACAREGLVVG